MMQKQIDPFETHIKKQNIEIREIQKKFETNVQDVRKETLWRIQDAEELIKSRVSEGKLNAVATNLKSEFKTDL